MFTEQLDRKLIRHVKNNPVLYDHNDPKHMDYDTREVIWQKIGDDLKRPATDCKLRWINMRDVNRRKMRQIIDNPGISINDYKYAKDMSFMRHYYKGMPASNVTVSEQYDDQGDNDTFGDQLTNEELGSCPESEGSEPIHKKKRKSKRLKANKKRVKKELEVDSNAETSCAFVDTFHAPIALDPTDPVDSFLLSINTVLKKLSPYHLNMAKTKIFAIVQECELQNIVEGRNGQGNESEDVSGDSNFSA